MTDEEKKAIDYFRNKIGDFELFYGKKITTQENEYLKILLNLIEKQSKEIEELKQIKSKLDEKNIPIETLLAEFERLEDLEDDLTTVYLNGVYDGEKKAQDKIKAKIEEVQNMKAKAKDIVFKSSLNYIETELQSLLEKEFPTTITKEELEKRWKE